MPVSNEEIKQHLMDERARILKQIGLLEESEYRGAGYGNHIADDATETFEQSKGISLKRNESVLLEQIENALRKFEQGTYGICEACGTPIDRARLEAIPYAMHCLKCQMNLER